MAFIHKRNTEQKSTYRQAWEADVAEKQRIALKEALGGNWTEVARDVDPEYSTQSCGSTSAFQNVRPEQREIPGHVDRLLKLTDELADQLAHLEQRLQPISSPRTENNTGAAYPPDMTELGGALGQLCIRLSGLQTHIAAIEGRLEI